MTLKGQKSVNLGTGSYVVRNLCEYHNGRLSPFDAEAVRLFEGTDALARDKDSTHLVKSDSGQKTLKINGKFLERWFAKTAINAALFEAQALRKEKPPFYLSAANVVPMLFDDATFSYPFGLHIAKRGVLLNPNLRKGVHCGLNYTEVHHHNVDRGWTEHSVPVMYYVALHKIELVGFFNITELSNDFALQNYLKKYADFITEKTSPLPFKIGFNLPEDASLGLEEPARIIDLTEC